MKGPRPQRFASPPAMLSALRAGELARVAMRAGMTSIDGDLT